MGCSSSRLPNTRQMTMYKCRMCSNLFVIDSPDTSSQPESRNCKCGASALRFDKYLNIRDMAENPPVKSKEW